MRIAYVLPVFPDPYKSPSGHLRPYHFIRELSQRHEITLFALSAGEISAGAVWDMQNCTQQTLLFDLRKPAKDGSGGRRGKFARRTQRAWRVRQTIREMKESFAELATRDSFDVVIFQGKHTFPVIENCELPVVVDFCDATSLRMRQSMRYADVSDLPWRLMRYLEVRYFESRLLRKTRYRAFISGRDREAILGRADKSKIIPNGVDLAYWTRSSPAPDTNCIVYTGVMEYPPNADGAFYLIEKILPLVRKSVPNIQAFIVGRDPSPTLIDAARQVPGVTVTGFVDDMRPYLERASVYVAPLRYASGMQNKLLEAMAMRVPVVTTPIGAQGIQVERGGTLPVRVAQGETHIAESIVDLLNEPEQRGQLAADGRRYVEAYFDWSRSAAELEQLCLQAIAPAARQRESAREAICFSK